MSQAFVSHLLGLARLLREDTVTPRIFPEAMEAAAYRINELEAALALLPDYVETFRIMRAAGRARAPQAKAVADRLEAIVNRTRPSGRGGLND